MLKMLSQLLILLVSVLTVFCDETDINLPDTIKPLHYQILIQPDFASLTFYGESTIKLKIDEATSTITLHSKNLTPRPIVLINSNDGSTIPIESGIMDENTLSLFFKEPLNPGLYDLSLTFSGKINTEHEGLYVTSYKKDDTENKILLTNLRYNKARQVFPCFDDPKFPATFAITIRRPDDYISVSNMPLSGQNDNDDSFATSDMLITYLVSFAVIDFKSNSVEKNVHVYSVNNNDGVEALLIEANTYLNKLNAISKINLNNHLYFVVVPDNCLSTAVLVNPGLIIARESKLVHPIATKSSEDIVAFYLTLSYVISKQLIVDYEEPEIYWENLWSKEGTSILLQNEMIDENLKQVFTVDFLQTGFESDVGNSAITLEVSSTDSASKILSNPVFHSKSFAIMRMIENLILPGELTENLIYKNWPSLKGYPVVEAKRQKNSLTLTQKQNGIITSDQIWNIPINILEENNQIFDDTSFTDILDSNEKVIQLDFQEDSWIILNKNQFGYYRVNYDEQNWNKIITYLNGDYPFTINPYSRAQLIDDAFSLSLWNELPISTYLNLIHYIKAEESLIPLLTFFKTASRLKVLLTPYPEVQKKFVSYASMISDHLLEKVGLETKPQETINDKIKRIRTLKWLCSFEHESCLNELSTLLAEFPSYVDADFEEYGYCGGLYQSNLTVFMKLITQHADTGKKRILRAMGCTSDFEMIEMYVSALTDDSLEIKLEHSHKIDAFRAIVEGSQNGVDVLLSALAREWDKFTTKFSLDEMSMMLEILSKHLITNEHENWVKNLMNCDDVSSEFKNILQSIDENLSQNKNWLESNWMEIDDWFEGNTPPTPTSPPTTLSPTTLLPTTLTPTTLPPTTPDAGGYAVMSKLENSLMVFLLICVLYSLF